MINAMEFTIKFDRNIDKNIHYISPGGYSVNGKQFDFMDYEGSIDGDKLHCTVHNFDKDLFEEAAEDNYTSLSLSDFRKGFDEFFIYTGEYDDAEIIPKEILNLTVYFDNGTSNTFRSNVLKSATEAIGY